MNIEQHRAALARIKAERAALHRQFRVRSMESNRAAFDAAQQADGTAALEAICSDLAACGGGLAEFWRRDEELVRQGNIHVRAINEYVKGARQARKNAAQARATYAKTCRSCSTVHAGDCY